MSRRGLIILDELEIQLTALEDETRVLREQLQSRESQQELRERSVEHLRQLTELLVQGQPQLDAIEADDDVTRKQQLLALVIREMRVVLVTDQASGKLRKAYDFHMSCLV